MQILTVELLHNFALQLRENPKAIYKRTIAAAIQGLQDDDAEIRSEAMALFDVLFANGYGFQEAADLIKSGRIKETFDHQRLTTGIIQLFHKYNQEALLDIKQ